MWKCAVLLLCLTLATPSRAQPRDDLVVFAAASLTDALRDIARLWEATGNPTLRFSFAASSTLARQIDQGAKANLFASADLQWMDWAQGRNLIAADTRTNLLGNRLVLVMPKAQLRPVEIGPGFNLLAMLGPTGRLATGDPAVVPVGLYAREALEKLGLWAAVAPRLAKAENVRSALLLVERGEAPLGIVYATDARAAPAVGVAGTFPANLHAPITYPFAVPRAGDTPAARAFLTFLAQPAAMAIFIRHGFLEE